MGETTKHLDAHTEGILGAPANYPISDAFFPLPREGGSGFGPGRFLSALSKQQGKPRRLKDKAVVGAKNGVNGIREKSE